MPNAWKKGRGRLGALRPLLGKWIAEANSEMGHVRCTRVFDEVLNGAYVQLTARWEFGAVPAKMKERIPDASRLAGRAYEEIALIGVDDGGALCFWSFTSDGKSSQGALADVSDIHRDAIGFEAKMPAGLAHMAYWPAEDGGFHWAVESKNAKGWRRFTEHHYRSA